MLLVSGSECVDSGFELLGISYVSGLLALHGVNDDLVSESELLGVGVFVCLIHLDTLSEEILRHGVLNLGCVLFLIGDPAADLIGISSRVSDLAHSLLDGLLVCLQVDEDSVIGVDTTWDLAMGVEISRCCKREYGCCCES